MAVSPWAVIRNAQTPIQADTPSVWAPIPDQPMEQSDVKSKNLVNHFGEGPGRAIPQAALDPEIANTQEQLDKIRYAQTHPWGTPENHPGKLGKLAHVFSEVGNIAGNIVAPNVMANIPQTQLGMKANEERLTGRLNEEEKNKALEQEQGAQAGHLNAETQEVAPNAATLRHEQEAQARNLESETNIREHPLPAPIVLPGMLTAEGQPVTYEPHSQEFGVGNIPGGLHYGRMIDRTSQVSGTLNGHPFKAGWDPIGRYFFDPDTQQPIQGFQPQPQPAMQGPVMVTPQGHVLRATPGTNLPAGAMTPSQSGNVYEPTGQEKTAAGRAQIVLNQLPRTIAMIDQNQEALGPAFGRWSDFMQNKAGFNAPGYAALRQDLMMMSSAVALAHAVGRLPENLREEFDNAIKAPQQTPENLKAILGELRPWMQDMAGLATPGANQGLNLGFPQANIPQAQGSAPQGADNEVYVKGKLVGHTVNGRYVPLEVK